MPLSSEPPVVPQDLLEKIECQFCNELRAGPSFHCECGYLFCGVCAKLLPCGKCGENLRECKSLTSLMGEYTMSCPNKNNGCSQLITFDAYTEHMKVCQFVKMVCPICGIPYKSPDLLGDHLSMEHSPILVNYEIPRTIITRNSFRIGAQVIQEQEHNDFYVLLILEDGISLHHLRSGRRKVYDITVKLGPMHKWFFSGRTTEFQEPAREGELKITLPAIVFEKKPTEISLTIYNSSSWHV